jgi:hypothetical protein
MPSLKCGSCGHRMMPSATLAFCTNCGTPLSLPSTSAEQEPAFVEQEQAQAQSMIPYVPRQPMSRASHDEALMEYPSVQRYRTRDIARYQPPRSNIPPDPYIDVTPEILMDSMRLLPPDGPLSSRWQRGNLPWWFPARPPDVEGIILHVQSQMEHPLTFDIASIILKQIRDFIWMDTRAQGGHSDNRETVFVTMLRIRMLDGNLKDVRLEGYLTGAQLSLGDTVFLWGRRRKGTLFARRGYNNTSKGTISTRSSQTPLQGVLLLALAILACYVFFFGLPFLPHFPAFFHFPFFPQHP